MIVRRHNIPEIDRELEATVCWIDEQSKLSTNTNYLTGRRGLQKNLAPSLYMKFSIHPDAETEFLRAIDYHEERNAGLGYEFAVEVYSAVENLVRRIAW